MKPVIELFFAAFLIFWIVWGVRVPLFVHPGRKGYRLQPHKPDDPVFMVDGWRRPFLRGLFACLLILVAVDLWYQLTGRGEFLH